MQLSFDRVNFQLVLREAGLLEECGVKGQHLLYDCFPVTLQAASELFQDSAAHGNVWNISIRNRIVVHTELLLLVSVYKVRNSVF